MAHAESKAIMGYLPIDPTHSTGGIDLLMVDLDIDAWTRLITDDLQRGIVVLL